MPLNKISQIAERLDSEIALFKKVTPVQLLQMYMDALENNKPMLFDITAEEEHLMNLHAKPLLVSFNNLKDILSSAISRSVIDVNKYVEDHKVSKSTADKLFSKLSNK
jgi:hypothetical protein